MYCIYCCCFATTTPLYYVRYIATTYEYKGLVRAITVNYILDMYKSLYVIILSNSNVNHSLHRDDLRLLVLCKGL